MKGMYRMLIMSNIQDSCIEEQQKGGGVHLLLSQILDQVSQLHVPINGTCRYSQACLSDHLY